MRLYKPLLTVFILTSALCLGSCTTPISSRSHQPAVSGLVVVGVTAKSGLEVEFSADALATTFSQMLSDSGRYTIISPVELRQYIGDQSVDELLSYYADTGQLAPEHVRQLTNAGLPAPRAIVARVEEDSIKQLPIHREPSGVDKGALLGERIKSTLRTQRHTEVSAISIDLRSGQALWRRSYQVDPVSETTNLRYYGSGFTGSLTAAFANLMSSGVRQERHPEPPELALSLHSLLGEISRKMP